MPPCTAPVTRKHKDEGSRSRCPACNPQRKQAVRAEADMDGGSLEFAMSRNEEAASPGLDDVRMRYLLDKGDSGVRSVLTERDDLPSDVMVELAVNDEDEYVREMAASSPSLGPIIAEDPVLADTTLQSMMADQFYGVRMSLASRPDLPEPMLLALAEDHHYQVQAGALVNPRLPLSVAVSLLHDANTVEAALEEAKYELPGHLTGAMAMSDDARIRQLALQCESVPLVMVMALAASPLDTDSVAANRWFLEMAPDFLGVSKDNRAARQYLIEESQWWTLDADSPEVSLARTFSPNP